MRAGWLTVMGEWEALEPGPRGGPWLRAMGKGIARGRMTKKGRPGGLFSELFPSITPSALS